MFSQHPIIPLLFCCVTLVIAIKQCFVKHRFLKVKVLSTIILAFIPAMILVFYKAISDNELYLQITNWILLALDVVLCVVIFTTINSSYSQEAFQEELTKSLDETKYFAILDRKDRVRGMSSKFLNALGITLNDAYGKNFFDVIEMKYRLVSMNSQDCLREDIQRFYTHYEQKTAPGRIKTLDLGIQADDASEDILHFQETPIFTSDKYKGRVLMGEMKDELSLIGMEKDLDEKSGELDIIKSRFVTVLDKTNEGIFFNDVSEGYIWCNDVLVRKLCLNGNSLDTEEFYKCIHPDDFTYYEEKMSSLKDDDYEISYRFNTGSNYIYVKEAGRKITSGKKVELCGTMSLVNNYGYAKTDTALDNIQGEPEMLSRLQSLEAENKIFETVYFRLDSIPEINEAHGRPIGNSMMSQYIELFMNKFVNDNQIYRVSGLEFVAFVTEYRKMEMLKKNVVEGEKLLHVHTTYGNQTVDLEVKMGISMSTDLPSHKDSLKTAKQAFKVCSNPNYNFNYAFFKEI